MTGRSVESDIRNLLSDKEIATGVVCMLCGVAGSGKTTLALKLEQRGLVRLSIDEYIWQHFGRYGLDYGPELYSEHQSNARHNLDEQLTHLLREGTPAVLDYSLWQRTERQRYVTLIEQHGRPWRLLVLDQPPSVIRVRLAARRRRFDANAAFAIEDDLLGQYLATFERPHGEGETVISSSM